MQEEVGGIGNRNGTRRDWEFGKKKFSTFSLWEGEGNDGMDGWIVLCGQMGRENEERKEEGGGAPLKKICPAGKGGKGGRGVNEERTEHTRHFSQKGRKRNGKSELTPRAKVRSREKRNIWQLPELLWTIIPLHFIF